MQGSVVKEYTFDFKGFKVDVQHVKPENFGANCKGSYDVQVQIEASQLEVFKAVGCINITTLCYKVQNYFLSTDRATLNPRYLFLCVEGMRSTLELDLDQAIFWKQHNEFLEKMKDLPMLPIRINKDLVETETVKVIAQKTRLGKEPVINEDCHEDWSANAHRHPQLY